MKKLLISISVGSILLISGCASSNMGTVTSNMGTMTSLGTKYKYNYILSGPDTSSTLKWQDDKITIEFSITDEAVKLKLNNKTNEIIEVIWDKASIVQFGRAQKVMHAGIKYSDRSNSQVPTIIPPNSYISDLALPTENVYYDAGYALPGGWKENNLYPIWDLNKQNLKENILRCKGQKLRLLLPIQFKKDILNYSFEFTITDVKPLAISNERVYSKVDSTTLININTATYEQLIQLPGMHASTADNIIKYRDKQGPFKAIEDLMNVSGVGVVTFGKIVDLITIEN